MATAHTPRMIPETRMSIFRAMDQRKVRWLKTTMTVKNSS